MTSPVQQHAVEQPLVAERLDQSEQFRNRRVVGEARVLRQNVQRELGEGFPKNLQKNEVPAEPGGLVRLGNLEEQVDQVDLDVLVGERRILGQHGQAEDVQVHAEPELGEPQFLAVDERDTRTVQVDDARPQPLSDERRDVSELDILAAEDFDRD